MSARSAALAALAVCALALGVPAQQPARQQTPPPADDDTTIVLRSDVVLVNVAATKGGAFVPGLTQSDFTVSEDGKPQEIAFFGAESTPFAVAILLDTSGSMADKLSLARAAAARFADRTRTEDRVAVWTFASKVRRIQDFNPGHWDLSDALWNAEAEGNTRLFDTVDEATTALAGRNERRRAILLISDGGDTGSSVSSETAIRHALAAGITIYTVNLAAVGSRNVTKSNEDMMLRGVLHGLADKSGGRYFESRGGLDLNDSFTSVVDELSHQYTLGYYPSNNREDGKWRRIDVSTSRPGVALRAREGYTAPKASS